MGGQSGSAVGKYKTDRCHILEYEGSVPEAASSTLIKLSVTLSGGGRIS